MLNFELNRQVKVEIEEKFLTKAAAVFNREFGLKGKFNFSLALIDAATIKGLNKNYRGKNKVTDVLSFAEEKDDFIERPSADKYLGEILICVSCAKKQAKEFGHSLKIELARLLVHGLAHLVGYEHEGVTKKKEKEMIEIEDRVMAKAVKSAKFKYKSK